ncbi:Holliday junction branch migration protein RuvA [[Mycoplasma] mobile]|nr:Holliday junction branch migration protein RuvA [[Mycoplasma] mobile]
MNIYKIGKIVSFGKNYFLLESNYEGFLIYAAELEKFEKDVVTKVFIYKHENAYSKTLYGFKTFKERLLFIDLLSINGIGPKTALMALESGYLEIMNLISNNDFETLSKLPFLGLKSAKQICFEFQSKYANLLEKENSGNLKFESKTKKITELSNTLKTLGFKTNQINYAISNINDKNDIEEMLEESIQLIANEKEQISPNT